MGTKSGVVPLQEASFLGFQIVRRKVRWSGKSHKKLKAEVKAITGRTRGVSPTKVMSDLTTYLRGALNYYVIGIPFARGGVGCSRWGGEIPDSSSSISPRS